MYPGIPDGYRAWPLEEREAWLANVPAAITFADEQRRRLDPRTPEGIYNLTLAQTGNVELAEKALTEARAQVKLAALQGATL